MLRVFLTIGLVLGLTASDAWCAALCGTRRAIVSEATQPSCHDPHPNAAAGSMADAPRHTGNGPAFTISESDDAAPGIPCGDACAGCQGGRPSVTSSAANAELPAPDPPNAPALPALGRASAPLRRPAARALAPPGPRTSRDVLARTSTLLL